MPGARDRRRPLAARHAASGCATSSRRAASPSTRSSTTPATACPALYSNVPWERHDAMLQVMVTGLVELTHRLLPGMIERGYGRDHQRGIAGRSRARAGRAHALRRDQGVRHQVLGGAVARGRRSTACTSTALCPGFTAQRVPRRDRHARPDEQACRRGCGWTRRRWREQGFEAVDGRHADLRQRPRESCDCAAGALRPAADRQGCRPASSGGRIGRRRSRVRLKPAHCGWLKPDTTIVRGTAVRDASSSHRAIRRRARTCRRRRTTSACSCARAPTPRSAAPAHWG